MSTFFTLIYYRMKNQILGIIYFSLLSKIDFCGMRFLDLPLKIKRVKEYILILNFNRSQR